MVDKKVRVAKAREFFLKGYNCSQSVFCAFSDMYSIPEDLSLKLSASFGGGIGRMRETCGAACGMFMLAGLESGQLDANDNLAKQKNYKLVQDLASKFKKNNGSIICRELLEYKKNQKIVPVPEKRTDDYYKNRPCLRLVESAAEIWSDYINGESFDDE
jgi:C_GCAxxG_C_C family probable redox protein